MIGAREGVLSGLRRLVAAAMARDLRGFVIPGADVARAHGLDLGQAGLHLATTPRHASVLLIVGPLPPGLVDAATIAYVQMPRPRAILALGADDPGPLPLPDATGPLTQAGLVSAMVDLRGIFAQSAFRTGVRDYDAPALETRTEYTCPMHPEVVQDEPGNCPKCGMTLIPRDTTATAAHAAHAMPKEEHPMPTADTPAQYTCPMHPEVVSDTPGNCPKCGMFLVAAEAEDDHTAHEHRPDHGKHAASDGTPAQYTCPMHPEVVQDGPGNCPKCGMFLVPAEAEDDHTAHEHGDGGHPDHASHGGGPATAGIEEHFMSMVEMTRDMPASPDGLKMEWIDVPVGPFFPGLPGGLSLRLTLDGDAVAEHSAESRVGRSTHLADAEMSPEAFVDHMAALSPFSPMAYRLLACLALERAAGHTVAPQTAIARAAAVERERVVSHLGWLAGFGAQSGFAWLERRAALLQLKLREATVGDIASLTPDITAMVQRMYRTPLLRARLEGIGRLTGDEALPGPVARASGHPSDVRSEDPVYAGLGFALLTGADGDALARLTQRTGEIAQSLDLIARAGAIATPVPHDVGGASGSGEAVVETPRGAAQLTLTLTGGKVAAAEIGTPTAEHLALIAAVADGQELGDALTAIGSLDISPWEMPA